MQNYTMGFYYIKSWINSCIPKVPPVSCLLRSKMKNVLPLVNKYCATRMVTEWLQEIS